MKSKIKKIIKFKQFLILLIPFSFAACNPEPEFKILAKKVDECSSGVDCKSSPEKLETKIVTETESKTDTKVDTKVEAQCAMGDACEIAPVALKPGVVTILLALGDIAQDKLIIAERSAQLIAQNAIRFATPVVNPKVLVVKDAFHNGEFEEDTEFIAKRLLSAYKADVLIEPASGLRASDLVGYDLVWFNNPGYPMGLLNTFKVLKDFKGGVVLSGDDMSYGAGFKTESLTGLKNINNGVSVSCNGQTFAYSDNSIYKYQVTLEQKFFPGVDPSLLSFEYGRDRDESELLYPDSSQYEVLAYAGGAKNACKFKRPVIVRYLK